MIDMSKQLSSIQLLATGQSYQIPLYMYITGWRNYKIITNCFLFNLWWAHMWIVCCFTVGSMWVLADCLRVGNHLVHVRVPDTSVGLAAGNVVLHMTMDHVAFCLEFLDILSLTAAHTLFYHFMNVVQCLSL